MGINDVSIIGVGKDAYNDHLDGMINGRVLPWVEAVSYTHLTLPTKA